MIQLLSDTLDNRQHRTVMPEEREKVQPRNVTALCLEFHTTAQGGRTQ